MSRGSIAVRWSGATAMPQDRPRSTNARAAALDRLDQTEFDLATLQTELEHTQLLATIGTLAAGMAHEINNVLTPVLAYAQLAKANSSDAALRSKALDKTIDGVHAASGIARAILGFSAPHDNNEHADVGEVIQAALDCLPRPLQHDGIRIDLRVPPSTRVSIGPLSLQQVLLNLILNACNALGEAGGDLTISATSQSDGNTLLVISDNGPGIPEPVAANLFEPFVTSGRPFARPGETATNHRCGSGLGLAVCRLLINEAGGNISVTSQPGQGATFRIVLPTSPEQQAKAG